MTELMQFLGTFLLGVITTTIYFEWQDSRNSNDGFGGGSPA